MWSGVIEVINCRISHVETVVLLRGVKTDSRISVDLDVEKLGIHDNKAIYVQIKAYMKEKYGFEVTNLYIAQVKEKVGLGKRDNPV